MRRKHILNEHQIRSIVMKTVNDVLNEAFPSKKIEAIALDKVRKLGEYGIISIKNAPEKFGGYIEIEKNTFYDYYSIGWHFNYGCPRDSKKLYTPEDVIKFLKDNNVNLYSFVSTVNPDLTNGL